VSRDSELLGLRGIGGLVRCDQCSVGQAERGASGEHVQHHPRGKQRSRLSCFVGVGHDVPPVQDRDGAATGHPHDLLAVLLGDDGRGVLVDADPQQAGALGDDHQQSAIAVALVEMLVDHAVTDEAEPRRELGHPLLRGGPTRPERHHV